MLVRSSGKSAWSLKFGKDGQQKRKTILEIEKARCRAAVPFTHSRKAARAQFTIINAFEASQNGSQCVVKPCERVCFDRVL